MIETILYIIAKVISLMLSAISLAMFSRVIMELVIRMTSYDISSNKFYIFCYTITEIVVTPVRYLCVKYNWFTGTPIDMPFFITYMLIALLQSFLPII